MKALPLGINNWKKSNMAALNSVHQTKKWCNFDNDWLKRLQGVLHSFF